MKIAIVCDWLVTYAGSERVLEQILRCFPKADLFAVVDFLPAHERAFLQNKLVKPTFIQQLPFAKKYYRNFLPLMPLAIEQLDMTPYDLVISSSHAVAKGILTGPDQIHISYTHSPLRYAWDLQHQYLQESGLTRGLKGSIAKYILHKMRLWDQRTANGIDYFIANSKFIGRRIWKTYRRESHIIHPPVDIHQFIPNGQKDDFYLAASRLVPYKKIDLIVESFKNMPDKKLIVIGDGPEFSKIKNKAGHNVELLGYQPTKKLISAMQRAKAFIFAAEEDFGIMPLEAQACGTPVIAYRKGGALETIHSPEHTHPTGLFFNEQNIASLCEAVAQFEKNQSLFTVENCVNNAAQFAPEKFREKFTAFVKEKISQDR